MAVEFEDGLYSIRLARWTNICVDVAGGGDASTTNVQLWSYYGGGGQIVNVTNQDDGFQIMFPLTGKVMDLQNGTVDPAQGGTLNVWQWPFNGGGAQRWDFIATGDTAVVNGDNLPVYMIASKVDTNYCLVGEGNAYADGTNLKVGTRSSAYSTMYYVFAPLLTPPTGTYKIASYLAGSAVLGVSGHSNANRASCVLEAETNDSNWQVFKIDNLDDSTCSIRCVENGKALHSLRTGSSTQFQNGDNLGLVTWNASSAQRWVTKYQGRQATRNGESMPLYKLINRFGDFQPCADVNGSKATPQTNVRMWQMADKDAQLFWLVPTEAYGKTLSVPSNIQGSLNGEYGTLLGANQDGTVYPAWNGVGEEWKVRYRTRTRKNNQAVGTRSEWSKWKALDDGSSTNDGWGVAGSANADAVLGNGIWTASQGAAFSLGTAETSNDLVQVEFQVAQLVHEWGDYVVDAHSGSASQVITIAKVPTGLGFSSAPSVTKNGVNLPYTISGATRKLSKLRIWSDDFFDVSASGNVAISGTLTASKILRIPENNESVAINWALTTQDGVEATGAVTRTVTVDWSSAANMTCTEAWQTGRKMLYITLPSGATDPRLWLDLRPNSAMSDQPLIEVEPKGAAFYVPYPFNAPFKITIVALVNGTPRKFIKEYTARTVSGRMWNFNHTGYCSGEFTKDGPPEETVDTSYTSDERPTTAGTWNRVSMGKVKSQSRSFTSITVDQFDGLGRKRVRELASARYAWYRNQEGEVCRVAIISVNETKHYWGEEFTVEMRRIDT